MKCVCLAAMAFKDTYIQSPTFSNEVVRVLQENVVIRTRDLNVELKKCTLPHHYLDPTIGIQEYKNDFSLSDEQIEIVA